MADFEEIQEKIEGFMKALSDQKTKEKYKILDDLKAFLLADPRPPHLNLDQIDYILIGEEDN